MAAGLGGITAGRGLLIGGALVSLSGGSLALTLLCLDSFTSFLLSPDSELFWVKPYDFFAAVNGYGTESTRVTGSRIRNLIELPDPDTYLTQKMDQDLVQIKFNFYYLLIFFKYENYFLKVYNRNIKDLTEFLRTQNSYVH